MNKKFFDDDFGLGAPAGSETDSGLDQSGVPAAGDPAAASDPGQVVPPTETPTQPSQTPTVEDVLYAQAWAAHHAQQLGLNNQSQTESQPEALPNLAPIDLGLNLTDEEKADPGFAGLLKMQDAINSIVQHMQRIQSDIKPIGEQKQVLDSISEAYRAEERAQSTAKTLFGVTGAHVNLNDVKAAMANYPSLDPVAAYFAAQQTAAKAKGSVTPMPPAAVVPQNREASPFKSGMTGVEVLEAMNKE